jgi:energy-coupling factor transporter ATP-binding protein EcfA2
MSWEFLGTDRIIKTTELSDFVTTEMIIPKELISFFGSAGERLAIIYQNREYPSYLETEGGHAKLKWSKVLIRKLGEAFPDYESWFQDDQVSAKTPRLEIIKANEVFSLRLITENEAGISEAEKSDPVITAVSPAVGLQELLVKWIAGYPNYYPRDFRFSFKDVINEEIPKVIESFEAIRTGHYKVQGFAGDTQWAEIPWVKVLDKESQSINNEDLYLAYILAMDSRKLYLAIVYGEEGVGVRSLSEKASEYRKKITIGKYQTNHQEVLLANASLVSGIVCYREYTETEMPADAILAAEFEDFRKMYKLCLMTDQMADEAAVSGKPIAATIKELDVRVENEAHEEIPESSEIFIQELAAENPEPQFEPVPTETVAVVFDNTVDEKLSEESSIDEIVIEENPSEEIPISHKDDEEHQAILVLENSAAAVTMGAADDERNHNPSEFLFDQETSAELNQQQLGVEMQKPEDLKISGENQTSVIGVESEVDQAAVKVGSDQSEEEAPGLLIQSFIRYPVKNDYLTPYLQLVQAKMGNKGYYYPAELIKAYYLSIKSKPFVMIKGRVGSGKTSFPRLFAEAIGASPENGRFKRLLVGKNWQDDTHLMGHLDSRGHFIPGPMMLMLKAAKEYPDKPHFLLLDEMDQSPVADYLRLLLEGINGSKEPFLNREDFGADITAYREYGSLNFPDNLYIIATINEGPDSFPVPARVIDSGNVISMPVVEIGVFPDYGSPAGDSDWENSAFKIHSQAKGLPEILERLMQLLSDVQQLLIEYGCPMGYRGKNEILAFGINSGAEGLFTEQEVIDLAILQRILPALECDEKTDAKVYQDLACLGLDEGLREKYLNQPATRFISRYEALLKAAAIPCPRSGAALLKQLKSKYQK